MSNKLQAELDALKADARAKKGEKEAVSFNVPRQLMNEFRAICEAQGLKHSHVIVTFIKNYVRENRVQSIQEAKSISHTPKKIGE
jgi:hypothetical protein